MLGQELQAQLLLAAFEAQELGLLPAADTTSADATVQGQAIARGTTTAKRTATGAKRPDVADRLRGKEERIIPIRRAG